ncbi:putative invertase inhibitor [Mercurialis annua]|uniref:putative invertase inhibitor n=1 Tax=Mercurialis annua TaxID=3986 RepID=UPI0024AD7976|nr:putative invertase inhibitor [Mercurialis annua]
MRYISNIISVKIKCLNFLTPLFFLYSIFLFFFFISNPTEKTSAQLDDNAAIDIVNKTCKKCAEKSKSINYGFCQTSLQVIPASHATNLQGMAVIAMELALENATTMFTRVKSLLVTEGFDPFSIGCLEKCLVLYGDALVVLVDGVVDFLTGHYGNANLRMRTVMEEAIECENCFKEKKGVVSPLSIENFNFLHLSDIAICIINSLSLVSPQR